MTPEAGYVDSLTQADVDAFFAQQEAMRSPAEKFFLKRIREYNETGDTGDHIVKFERNKVVRVYFAGGLWHWRLHELEE